MTWALRNGEQNLLERTQMRMLKWMLGIKRIAKIRNEEIRARSGIANILEARLRWLGQVDRKTEEDGSLWTPKCRKTETEVERGDKKRHEGEKYRKSTRLENVEIENSMRRPQIGKSLKKMMMMMCICNFRGCTLSRGVKLDSISLLVVLPFDMVRSFFFSSAPFYCHAPNAVCMVY